jgi:hypothetical protein
MTAFLRTESGKTHNILCEDFDLILGRYDREGNVGTGAGSGYL